MAKEKLDEHTPYGYTKAKEEYWQETLEMVVRLIQARGGNHEGITPILEAIRDTADEALIYYRAEQHER